MVATTFPFKGSDTSTYTGTVYPKGQAASAESAPVVLSTEQQVILSAILTAVQAAQVVSGTVAISGTVPVSGPLTDVQLRNSAVPVSAAALPLPSGAATGALQTDLKTLLTAIQAQNATALARFPTNDAQMAALIDAFGNVTLTANQAIGLLFGNQPVASNNRIPVDTREQLTPVSRSGTITTGGASQSLAASNTSRKGFDIQNQSSGPLYVNELGTATLNQNSLKIDAGQFWEWPGKVPTSALTIIGATTGQAFFAREW